MMNLRKHSSGWHCLRCVPLPPDSLFTDVLHGEGGVLPQLLGLLLQLAPGQDAVHRYRHQLDLNLVVWGNVVLQETRH